MRPILLSVLLFGVGIASGPVAVAQTPVDNAASARLHNGWRVTPAGASVKVGDMLIDSALSPDGKLLAMTNAGYGEHHLYLADAQTGRIVQTLSMERAWYGLAWSPNSATIYVSGGGGPRIHVFNRKANGTFERGTAIPLTDLIANPPETKGTEPDKSKGQAYVAGLALSQDGKTLYAANFATDTVYALSLPDGAVKMQRKLNAGSHPYCIRLAPDGASLYVTLIPEKSVVVLRAERSG